MCAKGLHALPEKVPSHDLPPRKLSDPHAAHPPHPGAAPSEDQPSTKGTQAPSGPHGTAGTAAALRSPPPDSDARLHRPSLSISRDRAGTRPTLMAVHPKRARTLYQLS